MQILVQFEVRGMHGLLDSENRWLLCVATYVHFVVSGIVTTIGEVVVERPTFESPAETPGGPRWVKSSFSFSNGNCVEVAGLGQMVGLRDSKDPGGPVLRFTPGEWSSFLQRR